MTLIFAANSLINISASIMTDKFAYNYVTDDKEQVQTEMVYKVDNQYLQHYIQYNYTYDDEGRVICKEALKWNDIRQAYERYYCLNFEYDVPSNSPR